MLEEGMILDSIDQISHHQYEILYSQKSIGIFEAVEIATQETICYVLYLSFEVLFENKTTHLLHCHAVLRIFQIIAFAKSKQHIYFLFLERVVVDIEFGLPPDRQDVLSRHFPPFPIGHSTLEVQLVQTDQIALKQNRAELFNGNCVSLAVFPTGPNEHLALFAIEMAEFP